MNVTKRIDRQAEAYAKLTYSRGNPDRIKAQLDAAKGKPCAVVSCPEVHDGKSMGPFCRKHTERKRRAGHPIQNAIDHDTMRRAESIIRQYVKSAKAERRFEMMWNRAKVLLLPKDGAWTRTFNPRRLKQPGVKTETKAQYVLAKTADSVERVEQGGLCEQILVRAAALLLIGYALDMWDDLDHTRVRPKQLKDDWLTAQLGNYVMHKAGGMGRTVERLTTELVEDRMWPLEDPRRVKRVTTTKMEREGYTAPASVKRWIGRHTMTCLFEAFDSAGFWILKTNQEARERLWTELYEARDQAALTQ